MELIILFKSLDLGLFQMTRPVLYLCTVSLGLSCNVLRSVLSLVICWPPVSNDSVLSPSYSIHCVLLKCEILVLVLLKTVTQQLPLIFLSLSFSWWCLCPEALRSPTKRMRDEESEREQAWLGASLNCDYLPFQPFHSLFRLDTSAVGNISSDQPH